jgi:hypothetical protein
LSTWLLSKLSLVTPPTVTWTSGMAPELMQSELLPPLKT